MLQIPAAASALCCRQQLRSFNPIDAGAIVYGLVTALGRTKLNPSPQRAVRAGEQIFMLRPGPVGDCPAARPLSQPVEVSIGSWDPSSYTMVSQDEEPLGRSLTGRSTACLFFPSPD